MAFIVFASSGAVVATKGVWPNGVAPLLRLRTTLVLLKVSAGEDSTLSLAIARQPCVYPERGLVAVTSLAGGIRAVLSRSEVSAGSAAIGRVVCG